MCRVRASAIAERRRSQKYPEELREQAVRIVLEIRERTGERHGAVTRVAKQWASVPSRCAVG